MTAHNETKAGLPLYDATQAGFYRGPKTGRIVFMRHIRHLNDGTGRIEATFTGTRDGKPFGRTFVEPIGEFFSRYEFVSRATSEAV